MTARLVPALVAALALAVGGCGFGPGEAKDGKVEVRVTRDFGRKELGVPARVDLRPSETVMRLLKREHNVTTRYGGAFVQSIDGLSGNKAAEHDWFFYVNGTESSKGAADYDLSPGDVVQWDHHRWTATMHVPAIVGAFPEPFVHGREGRRLPTRVECADPEAKACDAATDALGRNGATATSSVLGAAAGEQSLRVIVGRWDALRETVTARMIQKGPATSGVFADFTAAGKLVFLDGRGSPAREAPSGSGLVAATEPEGEGPVWVVTGEDDAGVERAAAALDPKKLRNAFAVAATPQGVVRLPEGGL